MTTEGIIARKVNVVPQPQLGTYTTRSGQKINLRLIEEGDALRLVEMFHQLSPESKRLRFHLYTEKIPEDRIQEEARALSDLDPQCQVAIIATVIEPDGEEHAVGVARFCRETVACREAEVAIVIRDDFQRRGLGKHLLLMLADKARELNITYFTAWVMSENIRLMKLIQSLEIPHVEAETRHGETKIKVPL